MTVVLHWIVALAIIVIISIGLFMTTLPNGPSKFKLYDLHNSLGIAVFVVALLQIYWRQRTGWPEAIRPQGAFVHFAKRVVHWALVLGTMMLPLSGIIFRISNGFGIKLFGLVVVPFARVENVGPSPALGALASTLHYYGGRLLIAALVLHILATMMHQLVNKDGTLLRMLGGTVKP
jgi:cytochrome b561